VCRGESTFARIVKLISGLSHKRDKPLFLCFFFGSISETDFKYSTLKEFIYGTASYGKPQFFHAFTLVFKPYSQGQMVDYFLRMAKNLSYTGRITKRWMKERLHLLIQLYKNKYLQEETE